MLRRINTLPPAPESAEDSGDGFQSEDSADSDAELQAALEAGLLKADALNLAPREKKRTLVNNVAGLKAALARISKAEMDWVERLDLSVTPPQLSAEDAAATNLEEDDFKRELLFYRSAQSAVATALPRLHSLDIPTRRPDDYYAQMAKSEAQMAKVRAKLVDIQEAKRKFEAARRLREERKYSLKMQKAVAVQRAAEKKELADAVKKHRKGMKEQLDEVLNGDPGDDDFSPPGKRPKKSGPGEGKGSKKRSFKDSKFGFGGRKKGRKGNDKESFGAVVAPGHKGQAGKGGGGWRGGKGKAKSGKKGGKKQRLGKSRRKGARK